jgi:hypothetical protein
MVRMFHTRWPAGVDEVVVNRLLNVVNDSLLEALWIVAEQLNARSRLFCDGLVTVPNGLSEITANEADHPFYLRL